MAKKKTKTVVNPSGLSIARADNKFTFTWKRGSSYTSQKIAYKINSGSWIYPSVSASATSYALTINKASYNPSKATTIKTIQFGVKGYYGKWSAWAYKTYTLAVPNKPFVESARDSTYANKSSYSWNFTMSTEDARAFTRLDWEAVLVPNSEETDGSKLTAWSANNVDKRSGTSTETQYSVEITEDTEALAQGSQTRWFRARTRGLGGDSAWNYTKQIYADPNKPVITDSTATPDGAGFSCIVSWETQANAVNPVDSTQVQYSMCVPAEGLIPPNNADWTDISLSADISQDKTKRQQNRTDSVSFHIDGTLNEDECLFVRVNTKWGNNTTYGDAKLIYKGRLKEPSGVSVNTNTNTITATNESDVPDSYLAIKYRSGSETFIIGIIPRGRTSTVVSPPISAEPSAYGVYAVVGTATQTERYDGGVSYAIDEQMSSTEWWQDIASVPVAPQNVTLEQTGVAGVVRVTWDWTWNDASKAILSWADHDDAWESTEGPEEYTINNPLSTHWNIGGLATGKTWYVKVRLDNETEDAVTEGPWSETKAIMLSSAPAVPSLAIANSRGYVTADSNVTVYWSFVSTDGTSQAYAQICADSDDNIIAHTDVEQQVTFNPTDLGWSAGETHALKLMVTSKSQKTSDWSSPVYVTIVPRLEAEITSTSLANATTAERETLGASKVLKSLPMTVVVAGAGSSGTSSVTITRADSYHMARPDETEFEGFEGESIAVMNFTGEGEVEITKDDLIGSLDDGAKYTLTLTVKDNYGQTDTESIDFGVDWTHQATMPGGTVVMDGLIAKITPVSATGMTATDTCDIYRLSADRPELIVKGAEYGTTYVDPYPAIEGGYRFVCVTANGDYITAENMPAWVDIDNEWEYDHSIIDFDGEQVLLYYNLDLSNNWEKDFQATRYLGGSVKGDWNAGVMRSSTLSTVALVEYDEDVINGLRLLSEYTGICHIRTLDGSSFKADLQVQEDRDHDDYGTKASFSISATRVDPEELDGMTLEQWSES